jgi:hypothetical protein
VSAYFRSIPERAPGSFDEELALRSLAHRIRRREVKYLEKLATKYRTTEMLVGSPFNASSISIPLPIPDIAPPMSMPNPRPTGCVIELPEEGGIPPSISFGQSGVLAEK